ncbi:hypothetical protein [Marispirochaeta sp.]|jgi:hypothetical protein|uniref:hypothetical protein n=1 Tax=Marispirochaeta sp. TaxID=2038653 RepID=UPI0029C8762D|nr:hypothetical protein [Marispirochaeta sp.]
MARDKVDRLVNGLAEHFASAWRLLSDTTIYLSSLPSGKVFQRYENTLRKWRHRLESERRNPEVVNEVRSEIVAFRKTLRKLGYDIRLGTYEIKFEGFRHDDAIAEGFQRMVLFIAKDNLYYLTGSENHIELDRMLERRLHQARIHTAQYRHYLWYRWRQNTLVLSGADSEMKDSFERLQQMVKQNTLFFIKHLKKLS